MAAFDSDAFDSTDAFDTDAFDFTSLAPTGDNTANFKIAIQIGISLCFCAGVMIGVFL